MLLNDLINPADLELAVERKLVRAAKHPTLPVTVYKYTPMCTYLRLWSDVTRLCRGLVVHDDGTVLARPFSKFFNFGEPDADHIDCQESVVATDKVDGSMGAAWNMDGWRLSTPGSADSEQARWGTQVLRNSDFEPLEGVTYVFEIVYPGSKVVVDYDFEGLVLLAGVDIRTGRVTEAGDLPGWSGRRAEVLPIHSIEDALRHPNRPNREGMVLRTSDGRALKIKQDDYVRLHRLVTGLTDRHIAEAALSGTVDDMLMRMPEETHPGIEATAAEARRRFDAEVSRLRALRASVPACDTQKQRAIWVKDNIAPADRWAVFPAGDVSTHRVAKEIIEGF